MSTEVGVILVAGVGQRLRPLTDDRPKALMDVGGETILGRATRLLLGAGVRELVLATGYREDAVKAAMAGCPVPVTFVRNDAYDRTQNSVSLLACEKAINGRSFFKLDGDLLFHAGALTRVGASTGALAAAIEAGHRLGEEEMKVLVEGDRITAFGKHLDPAKAYGESIGLERVSGVAVSSLFHAIGNVVSGGNTSLYYEDVYARLVEEGLDARAVDVSDLPWTEVDTREDLDRARELVASGRLDAPVPPPRSPLRIARGLAVAISLCDRNGEATRNP